MDKYLKIAQEMLMKEAPDPYSGDERNDWLQ